MDQSIKAGSTNLFYSEFGTGEPLIFVHGIPTDYRIWNAQLKYLSKSFRAISYSRRYAYPNQNPGNAVDSTIEKNSEDLENLIGVLRLNRVQLVGHSYGGFVSLFTAWKNPELFRSLVLVEPAVPSILVKNEKNPLEAFAFLLRDPSAAVSARKFQSGKLRAALKAYESGDFYSAVKNFYDGIREKDGAFEAAPTTLQNIMKDNGQTIGELETVFPIFSKEDAKKIAIPTLLVKGQKSPKWLRAIVDGLGKSIPGSSVVEISGAGHFAHADNPEEFNSKLANFVSKYNA
jgi:non-heme chloroperoxidase